MKTEHSPTPWRTETDEQGRLQVKGGKLAVCAMYATSGNAHEDAQLILRAVNSHAALVEACEAAFDAERHAGKCNRTLCDQLEAALALAKGAA